MIYQNINKRASLAKEREYAFELKVERNHFLLNWSFSFSWSLLSFAAILFILSYQ